MASSMIEYLDRAQAGQTPRRQVAAQGREGTERQAAPRATEWGDVNVLSTIAHDLRGPLTALTTSSELLVEDFDMLDRGEIRSMVTAIHRRAIWVQGLVENLLCAAIIREGRFRLQPECVRLDRLARETQSLVEPLLAQRAQRVRLHVRGELPDVVADARRVGQVLMNLLLNASKFSGRDAVIDISLTQRGSAVRVAVADHGPGLPAGRAQRLFEPFYREAANGRAGSDGLGLGLSIVKSIVEAHGGRVGAMRRRSGGARFWFDLPLLPVVPGRDAGHSTTWR